MTQAWPWPILPQGQIGSYMCLNGEKFYKVINWEKLALNDQFDRNLCFWQKNVPRGLSAPAPGLYTYIWPLFQTSPLKALCFSSPEPLGTKLVDADN